MPFLTKLMHEYLTILNWKYFSQHDFTRNEEFPKLLTRVSCASGEAGSDDEEGDEEREGEICEEDFEAVKKSGRVWNMAAEQASTSARSAWVTVWRLSRNCLAPCSENWASELSRDL